MISVDGQAMEFKSTGLHMKSVMQSSRSRVPGINNTARPKQSSIDGLRCCFIQQFMSLGKPFVQVKSLTHEICDAVSKARDAAY